MPLKLRDGKTKDLSLHYNIAGIALFLVLCAAATYFSWPYITGFIKSPGLFQEYVRENFFSSIMLYLALQVLQVVVAVIPGEFLEVAAGFAFGWFWGLLLALLGIAIGTVIIFIVFRKFGKPLITRLLGSEKMEKIEKFDVAKRRDPAIFVLFLLPGIPKDLITYAAAFSEISIWRFLAITLIARIPSVVTSTYAGKSIIEDDYVTAIIIFLVTGLAAVYIAYRMKKKR